MSAPSFDVYDAVHAQAKIELTDGLRDHLPTMKRHWLLAPLLSAAITAHAHVPGAEIAGFSGGFAHSLLGADHLLAALAVGCLAGWCADRARWRLPLVFVASMTLGIGTAGLATVAMTERLIAISVVILGLLIARGQAIRSLPLVALVGVFAWFHGQAHGAALSNEVDAIGYALGVVSSTGLLHVIGVVGAKLAKREYLRAGLRAGGVGMTLTGALWVVGAI